MAAGHGLGSGGKHRGSAGSAERKEDPVLEKCLELAAEHLKPGSFRGRRRGERLQLQRLSAAAVLSGPGGGSVLPHDGRDAEADAAEGTCIFDEAVYGCSKDLKLDLDDECEECNGVGGFGEKTCPTCNGRGRVITQSQSIFGVIQQETTCPDCKGKGKTYDRTCTNCKGNGHVVKNKTISVEIPAGIDNGSELRISGKGSKGYNGGPNGDIYLQFKVKEHPIFKRESDDIYLDLPITITEAVLGCKKEVPTLYGNVVIQIDSSTQSGTKLRLKGKGVENPRTGKKGDMYIVINVMIPEKLDKKQKDLFKELDKTNLETNSEFKEINKYL